MSAFCPVERLKEAVGEKELPPELERSGNFTILSVEGKLFLLSRSPMTIERLGMRFLQRVGRFGLSSYEKETLASRLEDCRDYLPLELSHRLDGAVMARRQIVADALSRGDIPLYRIKKPVKYHAPAKKMAMPVIDTEQDEARPAQTGIPKPKTPTHWVEFCYQYEDNHKPISNVPFVLTMPDGSEINGMLPDNGKVRIEDIKKPGEASIAYGEPNAKQEADQLRAEIKQALDTIIEEERAEAEEIEDWFDDQNFIDRFYIRQFYLGKGIVNGAWGLFQWVGDAAEAILPFGVLDSMIQAGIKEKYEYQNDEWKKHFLKNFTEEHKKKVVKALGFDPSALTRENLAEAYETYVLIKNDPESKKLIWGFIEDYVDAQHELEVIESGGELGFEFILAAVLAAFTGGTGAATFAPRLSAKMPKLGQKFQKLATAIKKVKLRKTTKGHTNKSTTTNVKRPEKKQLKPKKPSKPSPEEVKLSKSKGNSPAHIAAREKVARHYLENNGFSDKQIIDALGGPEGIPSGGVDLTKPVEVMEFPPPEYMSQFVRPHGHPGNWFDPLGGQSADSLGLNSNTRKHQLFKMPKGNGLLSHAKPIVDDWTVAGESVKTSGGGAQLLVNDIVRKGVGGG